MELKELIKFAKITAKANPTSQVAYSYGTENFSYADLNETLRQELKELTGYKDNGNVDMLVYSQNKYKIFQLIREVIDDVLPARVEQQYMLFAEVKTYAQGAKPVFTQKITAASRKRAKQFVTKVGLAGKYEVFKLDGKTVEVPITAIGAAAQIAYEEFLDGRVDFADLMDVIMEGMDEAIYREVERALKATIDVLPAANQYSGAGFNETAMDNLVAVAASYGTPMIYCTREFAAKMIPAEGWVSDNMRDERWNNGYLANYKGTKVIVLNQSFTDVDNSVKVIDPSFAWIIPSQADKPVKVAFEGQTQIREVESREDWAKEIQTYKKMGVATLVTNNICVYEDTSLTPESV